MAMVWTKLPVYQIQFPIGFGAASLAGSLWRYCLCWTFCVSGHTAILEILPNLQFLWPNSEKRQSVAACRLFLFHFSKSLGLHTPVTVSKVHLMEFVGLATFWGNIGPEMRSDVSCPLVKSSKTALGRRLLEVRGASSSQEAFRQQTIRVLRLELESTL